MNRLIGWLEFLESQLASQKSIEPKNNRHFVLQQTYNPDINPQLVSIQLITLKSINFLNSLHHQINIKNLNSSLIFP
jgi:hypothetical protein